MTSSARSRPSATSNRQNRGPTPLPTYQPLQNPLNESAQRALQNLPRDHKLDSLRQKLKVANNHLTAAAADINDRLQVQNVGYERQKKRLEKQGSQDSNGELDARMAEVRAQTDEMTGKLEGGVRNIIDASAEVESMERALKELQENVREGGGRVVPTQSTLGASYNRPARGGRRQGTDSDDEGSDSQDNTAQPIPKDESVIGVLKRKVADQHSEYQAMSMARRYAHHNDYVGFKKIVHDAKYPDDQAPPMPNASTWFPSESPDPTMPNTRSAVAGANDPIDDDDEDVAVASERISIKCPLTLLPMRDPVTSQKCPHSFEKEAILSMIGASDVWVGGSGRRGDGQKGMKCPVCEVLLTAADLKENPVLVRKIKRIQTAHNAQNEDFSDDEDNSRPAGPSLFGGSKYPEEVSSSPMATRTPRLKSERRSLAPHRQSRQVSMVPNSQVVGSQVVNLEDEDEETDG